MTDTKPPVATDEATTAPRHAAIALVLICMAQLMVVLDSTIANIALPYMGTDLNVDDANLQWIVTGYALAFGGLLLVGGRLGDLYGRRNVFMIGVTVFAIASALGGLAQNEAMLLGSRGLQGVGAALASPTALALITTTFPAGPQRNRAFGVFAMMSGLGAAIGLILGGWLTGIDDNWGWRLTFLINVPIGLAAAALAPRFLPDSQRNSGRLDLPGAITGTVALLSLVFGITRTSNTDPDTITVTNPNGEAYGWGDPTALTFIGLAVLLLVVFVLIEKRTRVPMLPLNIFANRTRSVAFLAMMITPAAMFAMFFFLSLFVQNIMGYEPLHTGFAFLPFCIGMVAAATASSNLASKVDPRYLAGIGTLLAGFSLYMFSRLSIDDSPAAIARVATGEGHLGDGINYWLEIAPFIFTMAVGMGLTFVPMTLAAVHHIRSEDAGIGSGVLNTMQQVGGALGLATLSAVAFHFTQDKAADLAGAVQSAGGGATQGAPDPSFFETLGQAAFAEGATQAFFVGAIMIWVASAIIWAFLNVKHEEMATDGPEGGVHV